MSRKENLQARIEKLQARMSEIEQKEIERIAKKENSKWIFNDGRLVFCESETGFKYNGEYYDNIGNVEVPETFVSKFLPASLYRKLVKTHAPVKAESETIWTRK